MSRTRILLASTPFLVLGLGACGGGGGGGGGGGDNNPRTEVGPVVLEDLRVDGGTAVVAWGEYVATTISETFVGEDLNKDGDTDDLVLRIENADSDRGRNLGVATNETFETGLGFVVFPTAESSTGQDLNNDGDTTDQFLLVHEFESGTTWNPGLTFTEFAVFSDSVFFCTSEAEQSDDLNKDGDMLDELTYVIDSTSGVVSLTTLENHRFEYGFGRIAILQSRDTNGLERYDLDLGLGADTFDASGGVDGGGKYLAFERSEIEEDEDLNMDGDKLDEIVYAYDFPSDFLRTTNTDRVGGDYFGFAQDFVAFPGEFMGDLGIIEVDILSSVGQFIPLLAEELLGSGNYFLARVSEATAAADLNGDGDQTDEVLHSINTNTLEVDNVGLAFSEWIWVAGSAYVTVSELEQNATDLNGDGDTDDLVLHRYDPIPKLAEQLGNTQGIYGILNDRFLLTTQLETTQDLTGDGDTDDWALEVYDVQTRLSTALSLGVEGGDASIRDDRFVGFAPALLDRAATGGLPGTDVIAVQELD